MSESAIVLRSLLLASSDLGDAVRFYRDVVGLALRFQDGDVYAEFDTGDIRLALAAPGDHPDPTRPLPVFKAPDLDAAVRRLVAGGAVVVGAAHDGAHERRALLQDPDGNAFVVYSHRS